MIRRAATLALFGLLSACAGSDLALTAAGPEPLNSSYLREGQRSKSNGTTILHYYNAETRGGKLVVCIASVFVSPTGFWANGAENALLEQTKVKVDGKTVMSSLVGKTRVTRPEKQVRPDTANCWNTGQSWGDSPSVELEMPNYVTYHG